jgi:hypothetical protein
MFSFNCEVFDLYMGNGYTPEKGVLEKYGVVVFYNRNGLRIILPCQS